MQYHEFRLINQKWHKKTADAFSACIESRDYMCIRNAILILTKVAKFFPLFQVHGNQLESVVSALIAEEKREDLKVLALGYVQYNDGPCGKSGKLNCLKNQLLCLAQEAVRDLDDYERHPRK